MEKPTLFISHTGEEAKLADLLKSQFMSDFLELINVFVSSDSTSITVGNKWLNDIDTALKTAQVELILCSEESVKRPWINFEAGAGWVKGIPVVPVCHTGMRPVDLPIPLNMLQAIEANDENGLKKVYVLLAKNLGSATPTTNFAQIIKDIKDFEQDYGVIRLVRSAVQPLIKLLPELEQIFRPSPINKGAQGEVPDVLLEKMRPHLDLLQNKRLLDYAAGSYQFRIGENSGGGILELKIQVHDSYYQIAQQVMK